MASRSTFCVTKGNAASASLNTIALWLAPEMTGQAEVPLQHACIRALLHQLQAQRYHALSRAVTRKR